MKRLVWALSFILILSLSLGFSTSLAQQTSGPTSTAQPIIEPTQELAKPDFIAHLDLPGRFAFVLQKNVEPGQSGCNYSFIVGCGMVYIMDGNGNTLTLIRSFPIDKTGYGSDVNGKPIIGQIEHTIEDVQVSPDGNYAASKGTFFGTVYISRIEEPNKTIASLKGMARPSWSFDSQLLVGLVGTNDSIAVGNRDGSNLTILTLNTSQNGNRTGMADFAAAWLPDNQNVGFVRNMSNNGIYSLIIMNTITRNQSILPVQVDNSTTLAWSPDGKYLAYSFNGHLFVSNTDGSSSRQVAEGSNPTWSPDSKHIAFLFVDGKHFDRNGTFPEVYVTDPSGSPALRLVGGHIQSINWLK